MQRCPSILFVQQFSRDFVYQYISQANIFVSWSLERDLGHRPPANSRKIDLFSPSPHWVYKAIFRKGFIIQSLSTHSEHSGQIPWTRGLCGRASRHARHDKGIQPLNRFKSTDIFSSKNYFSLSPFKVCFYRWNHHQRNAGPACPLAGHQRLVGSHCLAMHARGPAREAPSKKMPRDPHFGQLLESTKRWILEVFSLRRTTRTNPLQGRLGSFGGSSRQAWGGLD